MRAAPRHGTRLRRICRASAAAAAIGITTGILTAQQRATPRTFGPGHCGPIDPSYISVSSATGGQVLPLGPNEMAAAAPLMSASSGTETLLWLTSTLTDNGRVVTVPVDGVTSRVSFIASTDNSLADMVVLDPRGMPVGAGMPGVEAMVFGCVRGLTVVRPPAGQWSIRVHGAGTFWLVAHAKTDLALEGAAFVHVAGRPGHEGLFRIQGQPVADMPATLQVRLTREDIRSATFDLVSANGTSLAVAPLSPVTNAVDEDEYVGDIAALPKTPFRVRVTGRDRTGAAFQRVSGATFHAATVQVSGPESPVLRRGRRTPVRLTVRNVGAAGRFQLRAVAGAAVMPIEPPVIALGAQESREVTVSITIPLDDARSTEDVIVTAEGGSEVASNSAILHATIE